jgi:hypothetical protein
MHAARRLNDYLLFSVPLKNFPLRHGDVTIAGEGLQSVEHCSALRAFEFIVPHLL